MDAGKKKERALAQLRECRRQLADMQQNQARWVAQARLLGASWTEVGSSLGITDYSARRHYMDAIADFSLAGIDNDNPPMSDSELLPLFSTPQEYDD